VPLDVLDNSNHQYVITIANAFDPTQIATPRSVLVRLTEVEYRIG
jgi:hypothetical protein